MGEALFRTPVDLGELVHGLQEREISLELTHLRAGDPLLRAMQIGGEWKINFVIDDYCSVIDLPPGSTALDLRSTKTLGQLRRARAKIEKEFGPVEEKVLRTRAELDEHWPECPVKPLRWGVCGILPSRSAGEAERGHLCVVAGIVNGQWGSFDVMLQTGTLVELWFTRFDPRFKAAKPGHQLLRYISNNHDELGITTFDAMIGLNAYKQEWATSGYEVGSLLAVTSRRAGLIFLVVQINGIYRCACRVLDRVKNCLAGRKSSESSA